MLTVALPYTAYLVLGLSDSDPSEPADDEVRDGGDPEERSVSDSSVPGERSEVGEANAGSVLGVVPKEKLPTYNVFYEARTLSRGGPLLSLDADGLHE